MEADIVLWRNTYKIKKILANPNDYSLEDLLKLNEKELEGVPDELKEKLLELINKKQEEKFADELRKRDFHVPGDELPRKRKKQNPSPTQEPPELPIPQDINPPSELDYKKLYFELLAEVEKLKNELNNQPNQKKLVAEMREKITNSTLTEEQKQELLKLLEDKKKVSEIQPKPTNYWPWIIGGSIVISAGWALFAYLLLLRKRKRMKRKPRK